MSFFIWIKIIIINNSTKAGHLMKAALYLSNTHILTSQLKKQICKMPSVIVIKLGNYFQKIFDILVASIYHSLDF